MRSSGWLLTVGKIRWVAECTAGGGWPLYAGRVQAGWNKKELMSSAGTSVQAREQGEAGEEGGEGGAGQRCRLSCRSAGQVEEGEEVFVGNWDKKKKLVTAGLGRKQ
ncbi:hypothetical protein AAC387_Pa01g2223 [Persea americana]